ncbi:MAG: PAS domain-containing protein [Aquabacterium sp.]|nr:PAS domain-containing protein [Aquabacterium sp.]
MKIDPRIQVLLDQLPALVGYWDKDVRNRYGNRAYLEWFGLTPDQMRGRHLSEVIGPQLYALNKPYVEAALAGQAQTFDRTIVDQSGGHRHTQAHYIPDCVDGDVRGFFALVSDITDLQHTSEELKEAQRIGRLGSWCWDIQADRVDWSPELYRLFGLDTALPPPRVRELASLHPPDAWEAVRACVARAIEGGEPYSIEVPFLRADGTQGWLLAHGRPQCGADGKVVKLRGTTQDVSERKAMELALLASRNELRDMVAHHEVACEEDRKHISRELHDELGQLLSAMRMDIAQLRHEIARGGDQVASTIDDMDGMVDKMFQVARSVSTSLRPAALDFGLLPAIEWLAQDVGQRSRLACHLDFDTSDLPLRDAQAATIFRVVQESLTNVVRHAQATEVHITLRHTAHELVLSVKDDGCGFHPDEARKPAGFGLLSMRERVLSMGGQMHLDTAPGQGTVIRIHIPV